ncbi:MAG: AAA family ATPase [Pseudanabaena sp. ELA607]
MNNSESKGITKISISGFKSIANECSIDIRPLTILAGANSSGKSSIMQPILLMKQTLESSTDYGALRLSGDNLNFTSAKQILSYSSKGEQTDCLTVAVELANSYKFKNIFKKLPNKAIDLIETTYHDKDGELKAFIDMDSSDIIESLPQWLKEYSKINNYTWKIFRHLCFFTFLMYDKNDVFAGTPLIDKNIRFIEEIQKIIHVQGLRSLERILPVTGIGQNFSGNFEKYIASLIHSWQTSASDKLQVLNTYLHTLTLSKNIEATEINDTQIELKISRTFDSDDMVNIVDVGSGVSQILPVLVALVAAKPEQLVYLEEPEIHLHPRAQANLGEIIVDAANRGVRVVLETHSDLLLRRIQSLVAEDKISADKAILHWFNRDEHGFTQVTSTPLNATGGYGDPDFPLDFSDVFLDEEGRYLEAASEKRWKEQNEY